MFGNNQLATVSNIGADFQYRNATLRPAYETCQLAEKLISTRLREYFSFPTIGEQNSRSRLFFSENLKVFIRPRTWFCYEYAFKSVIPVYFAYEYVLNVHD